MADTVVHHRRDLGQVSCFVLDCVDGVAAVPSAEDDSFLGVDLDIAHTLGHVQSLAGTLVNGLQDQALLAGHAQQRKLHVDALIDHLTWHGVQNRDQALFFVEVVPVLTHDVQERASEFHFQDSVLGSPHGPNWLAGHFDVINAESVG